MHRYLKSYEKQKDFSNIRKTLTMMKACIIENIVCLFREL